MAEELTKEQQDEQMVNDAFKHLLDSYINSPHRRKVDIITKAFNFACHAHRGVRRLSGEPYIMHPLAVAQIACVEMGLGSTSICAALLHDVVEDTDVSFEQLEEMGFPKEAVDAIRLMTHEESVPYEDYVRVIKTNPVAAKVKLADLRHNSDATRLSVMTEKDIRRAEKYRNAMAILQE